MNYLLDMLAQFGGGRGDPGNNFVRFLLPSIFWATLAYITIKQWRKERERRDIIIAVAALIGLMRELLMFGIELCCNRPKLFDTLHQFYPPIEHAISLTASILIGYAFLRYFSPMKRFPRLYLRAGIVVSIIIYLLTAPLWIDFLKQYPEALFGIFWGDMVFRIAGAILTGTVIISLISAERSGTHIPNMLLLAFSFLFLDEFLMLINIAHNDSLSDLYAPIRHNLHIWAIPMITSVYWGELKTRVMKNEKRLTMLNDAFLGFGDDANKNINALTALAGELLDSTCAMYNRREDDLLRTIGQWHLPPDYNPLGKIEGRICSDVMKGGSDDLFVLRNIQYTPYAESDRKVLQYKLQTYLGMAVKKNADVIGALCLGYLRDYFPSNADKKLIGIIASAVGVEEERREEKEKLKKTGEELRTLSLHQESAREKERTLIAREIHDELGQSLTALNMDLAWLRKQTPEADVRAHEKIKSMADLVNFTIQSVKKLCTELRPSILDDFGLIAAIEWQAEQFQNRTGILCKVTCGDIGEIQHKELSTAIFRAFQEALTNIARHANATIVKVSLEEADDILRMDIDDNGIGINKELSNNHQSFGIIGIRERILSVGGDFKIIGIPNRGTILKISAPLRKRGDDNDDKSSHNR
ncbi:MAG: sensor histidine kinase [Nitrospirae bacterium]|nr:sensor histidine kinase [Nitrospirota bacterium]